MPMPRSHHSPLNLQKLYIRIFNCGKPGPYMNVNTRAVSAKFTRFH